MSVLVEVVRGSAPAQLSEDDLRNGILGGRIHPNAYTSPDGGQTWIEAWRVARLPPPQQQQPQGDSAADVGVRMLIPVGRSWWAIIAGYLGLLTLLADLGWIGMVAAGPDSASMVAVPGAASFVLLVVPTVLTGILGHRAIRNDPSKHGMGRVGFAYACAGLMVLLIGIALLRGALHEPVPPRVY